MSFYSRRQFISSSLKTAAALTWLPPLQATEPPKLVVVRQASAAELVEGAIGLLGGMSRFVKKGQSVLVKPNMSWDRLPEQAATTNPEAVAKVVELCRKAGARQIRVIDRTCNQPQRCYRQSGIERAAKDAGAQVRHIVPSRFRDVSIPDGLLLRSWPIYEDVFGFDVIINMPIAKSHNISGVTLGMKNIMGLLGGNRGELHVDFDTKIVDLNSVIRPALTIIDAYRILRRNGPSGGSLQDVEEKRIVIAGTDPVATDAYACRLFDLMPEQVAYLQQAHARGLGELDVAKVPAKEFNFMAN
ncbi:DUF362 domain-containing protein [candidate division KSB1 bacterium]|nr:DUF362 domain-containing protein [candidate division KSB1 bacterium]